MAPAKQLSLFFLLMLVSSLQIQARESKFFNNVKHYTTTTTTTNGKETDELPKKEETLTKEDEEPSFTQENQNGYGLYGHGSEQLPPTTDNNAYYTSGNLPEKTTTNEYTGGSYEYRQFNKRYPNNHYSKNINGYDTRQQGMGDTRFANAEYLNNNNNNGYETRQQEMDGERFADTGYPNNNNYYMYNNNGYATEQQGMSDTRFLENGKYFYDVKNENSYLGGYGGQTDGRRGTDGRGGYNRGGMDGRGGYNRRGTDGRGGYNGNNNGNAYEYNSMEGYQNQEQYQESQDEYEP
ncbi:PREDICTED: protein E6 [Nelumbo nucifera]|uniref:Protein E6 n=1 Tax=Nelumbo nucifera TaxID=4432 RepID=A0A1U8AWD5_NELNU|nr:PREDICTED: protein E6 [Nelumbo nucifera]